MRDATVWRGMPRHRWVKFYDTKKERSESSALDNELSFHFTVLSQLALFQGDMKNESRLLN